MSPRLWDELYGYQQDAVQFVGVRDGAALFFEQGTGKTWVTLAVLEQMTEFCDLEALLIVPLANLDTTWLTLIREKLPWLNVTSDWKKYKKLPTPKAMLTNYEGMPDIKREGVVVRRGLIRYVRKHAWSIVVYDESQRLKDRGSMQSRDARRLRHAAKRLILSGTPVEQCPADLWAQLRFVDHTVLGERWGDFEDKYLRKTGFMGYKKVFKKHMLPEFLEQIKPVCLRVEKADVLDLPEMTVKRHGVSLRGEQRELYDALEQDMVASIGPHTVTTELKITQMVKMQQVCGGFIKDDEGVTHRIGRAKIRKVRLLIPQLDGPVVVFCRGREEVFMLEELLPGSRVFHGKTPKRKRPQLIRDFQTGKFKYLICQIRTGGVGLDLFAAHHAIIYSSTFSFIDYDQAIARLHRIGQIHEVTIHLIFARGTIDEDIVEAVISKQSVSDLVLRRLKPTTRRPKVAKTAKKTAKKKTAKKNGAAKTTEKPKYGVAELADALEIEPATVRVKLRNEGVKKSGKSYGWDTKAAFDKVVNQLTAEE